MTRSEAAEVLRALLSDNTMDPEENAALRVALDALERVEASYSWRRVAERLEVEKTEVLERVGKLETMGGEYVKYLEDWLMAYECECPPEGHHCGRDKVKWKLQAARALLAEAKEDAHGG